MGESGRRSTLVSRLPIFRRSSSKRQDSLPSSPSSGGLANGVHTSSPSSTNSSSGSTGKRRSIFRAPSLGFSSKRHSDPRDHSVNLNLSAAPPANAPATDANGNSQSSIPTSVSTTGFSEGAARSKNRHSFGFGSHKQKKITRSRTEDFDKASSSSSSAGNRNVFINCISGSGVNEGDDSGFMDDFSGASNNNKRSSSSRQKKQLLPKSFSAHHRFSRTSDHHRPPEVTLEPPSSTLTPGSWPGELTGAGAGGESSLQSPMISEDRTTAITPSEFHPITEDSVSDCVDVLPTPSPVLPPEPDTVPGGQDETDTAPDSPPAPENNTVISTSQIFFSPVQSSAEKAPPAADTSTANNTDYETAVSLSEPETAVPCLPLKEQSEEERREREEERKEAREEASVEEKREVSRGRRVAYLTETSESEPCVVRSEGPGPDRRTRTTRSFQEPRGANCGCQEPRHAHLRRHAGSLCSSVSPYHGVMRLERRLRSSSEGAGGPHLHGNLRDVPGLEGCGLIKHRHNSSSSKLGSLDFLNNLGSSELDEDDLMLDLELSDDQRHRHVSCENSSQSLASCSNLLHSPLDPTAERLLGRDQSHSRPSSLLPAEGSSGLCVGREEEPLALGMETLPLRLMQQDCTAVKTLLLRLKRTLQESAETSPASSLQSLPISPCSEKSLPFKDSVREEALMQQLREKDELILKLQAELESARAALKIKDGQTSDRSSQTEHAGPEINPPGRWSGPGSSSNSSNSSSLGPRERRAARAAAAPHAGDHVNQHAPHHPLHGRANTAREERHHQAPPLTRTHAANAALLASTFPPAQPSRSRQFEVVSSSAESLTQSAALSVGARRGDTHPPVSQIPRAVGSSASSSLHSLSRGSFSSSDPSSPPPPTPSSSSSSSSSFAGRLGQPPRGPLSLHSYSRKNVFLQHSLQTAELQALTQRDS